MQNWCIHCTYTSNSVFYISCVFNTAITFILVWALWITMATGSLWFTPHKHKPTVAVSSLLCGFELNCDDDIKWVSFTGLCVYLVIVNLPSSSCSSALSIWQAWLRPLAPFALHLVHLTKSLCCMTVLLSALPHKANRQKGGVVMGVPKGVGGGWDYDKLIFSVEHLQWNLPQRQKKEKIMVK